MEYFFPLHSWVFKLRESHFQYSTPFSFSLIRHCHCPSALSLSVCFDKRADLKRQPPSSPWVTYLPLSLFPFQESFQIDGKRHLLSVIAQGADKIVNGGWGQVEVSIVCSDLIMLVHDYQARFPSVSRSGLERRFKLNQHVQFVSLALAA